MSNEEMIIINKVELIGRLTNDPEVRYTTNSNTLVVSFALAVSRRYAKKDEERQADFIYVIAWDKTGEFISKYFKKGQQVGIVGRLQTRNYEDKDGKRVYVTEVVAEEACFADSKHDDKQIPEQQSQPLVTDEDLPF